MRYILSFIVLSLILFDLKCFGQHLLGGEISYINLSANQYRLQLKIYRDCSSATPLDPGYSLSYSSVSTGIYNRILKLNFIEKQILSTACPEEKSICEGGIVPGAEIYTYSGDITLETAAADWKFLFIDCDRAYKVNTLSLTSGRCLVLEAVINNNVQNSSPIFAQQPQFYICRNENAVIRPGINDGIENDSLLLRYVTPKSDEESEMSYLSGFSDENPFTSLSGFEYTPQGEMKFTPTVLGQTGILTLKAGEYRNGIFIGSVMRDLMVSVQNCNNPPPSVSGINSTNNYDFEICQGATVEFKINSKDPQNQDVILSASTFPSQTSARLIVYNDESKLEKIKNNLLPSKADSVFSKNSKGFFKWETTGVAPGTYSFNITAYDKACPQRSETTKTFNIKVNTAPKVVLPQDFSAVCGNTYVLSPSITGGDAPLTYLWSTGDTQPSISVTSGTFSVKVTSKNGCVGEDILTISNNLYSRFITKNSCSDTPTSFIDQTYSSDGQVTDWIWDFGDGTTGSGKDTEHTYKAPGLYYVKLNVKTSNNCEALTVREVLIMRKPSISFTIEDSCTKPGFKLIDTYSVDKNSQWSYIADSIYAMGTPAVKILSNNNGPDFINVFRPPSPYPQLNYTLSQNEEYFTSTQSPHYGNLIDSASTLYIHRRLVSVYMQNLGIQGKFYSTCEATAAKTVTTLKSPEVIINEKSFSMGCEKDSTLISTQLKVVSTPNIQYSWGTSTKPEIRPYSTSDNNLYIDSVDTYVVIAKDENNCKSEPAEIKILPPFQSSFEKTSQFCSKNSTVNFLGNVKTTLNYTATWDFGDGTQVTQPGLSISHKYINEGNYTVKMILSDEKNLCHDTVSNQYSLYVPNSTGFDITDGTKSVSSTCLGKKVYVKIPNQPPTQEINALKWTLGDGTVIVKNSAPYDTSYSFKKTQTSLPMNLEITINDCVIRPVVDRLFTVHDSISYQPVLTQTDDYNYCAGKETTYKAVKNYGNSIIDSYNWTIYKRSNFSTAQAPITGDAIIFTSQEPVFQQTIQEHGLDYYYWANLHVKDSKGCVSDKTIHFGNERPEQPEFETGNLCSGQEIFFAYKQYDTIDPTRSSIFEEKNTWDFGNGNIISGAGQKFTQYSDTGTFPITLTVSTGTGCTASVSKNLVIKPVPTAEFTTDSTCLGDSMAFNNLSIPALPGTNFHEFTWLIGQNPTDTVKTTEVNYKRHFDTPGLYDLVLIAEDKNGCLDTATGNATILPTPTATYEVNKEDMYPFQEIPFFEYTTSADVPLKQKYWVFAPGDTSFILPPTPSTQTVYHKYDSIGIYYPVLYVENILGCSAEFRKKIDLFPYLILPTAFSPNGDGLNDKLRVLHKGIDHLEEFKIYNRWGELIFTGCPQFDNECSAWDGSLNGQPQPAGVYIIYAVGSTTRIGYEPKYSYRGKVTLIR